MTQKKFIALSVKGLFAIGIVAFFIWSYTADSYEIIFMYPEEFLYLLKQHLKLVTASSLLAILVAVPLGILITRPRFKKLEWIVLNTANLGQTIPSLAILALVMSFLGTGFYSSIFALFAYSILPILQNTAVGLSSIDPEIMDSAKGMGYTPRQTLWRIEIPNAIYSIMAGIRTALVMNIGTAALAYLVGGSGFGDWIFTGIVMDDHSYLLSGAVPVTLMAILTDRILRLVEMKVTPKGLQRSTKIAS
ncbi:ABC transporter permease [Bacillus tianshenii]|nr:ABC transporter permease [Bacillus tianshenii]